MKKFTILLLSVVMALCTVFGVTACSAKKYTLKFMVDGAEVHQIVTSGNEEITLPQEPTKTGYTFDGWYFDDVTFEQEFTANSLVQNPISNHTTIYAKFNKNHEHAYNLEVAEAKFLKSPATCTAKAVYYKSCECGEAGTQTFEYGEALGHDFSAPTYNFNADYSQCTATRICQRVNTHVETETVDTVYGVEAQPTYTAVGTGRYTATFENSAFETQTHDVDIPVKTCTVTIDVNGGNAVAESTLVATCGQTITLPAVTRTGYTFAGWKLDGEDFATTTAWSKQAETATLVAQWTAKTCTVTIEVNGGNELTNNTVTATYGEVLVLPTVTRTGYTFAGWKLNGEDFDSNSAWNLEDETATLVAQWTAKTCTVTIEVNAGNELTNNTETATYGEVLVLPQVTKTGYSLVGWKLNGEDFDATKPWTNDDNATLVAQWAEKTCTITLDVNYGDALTDNTVNAAYGQVVAGLPTPTKTGYTFAGWKLNGEDFDSNSAWNLEDETATLVAQWTIKTYTITFDANGGDALTESTFTATYDAAPFAQGEVPAPTRTNYVFAGWTYNGEPIDLTANWLIDSEITVVAKWNGEESNVTLNYNYEGSTNGSETLIYGEEYTLTATRLGYTLVDWVVEGTETHVAINGIWEVSGNVTLIAQWTEVTYNVTIKDYDGDVLGTVELKLNDEFDFSGYVPANDSITIEGDTNGQRYFSYFKVEGTDYKFGHNSKGEPYDKDYAGTWAYASEETEITIVLVYDSEAKWY